jgi:hypothetical protein
MYLNPSKSKNPNNTNKEILTKHEPGKTIAGRRTIYSGK